MRLLTVLMAILISVVIGGVWTNHQLDKTSDLLLKNIEIISMDISLGDWKSAMDNTAKLEKDWQKEGSWWPIIMDHQEMDNIEFTIARFKGYMMSRDYALSKGEITVLKTMIEHIPIKERITIKNIL